jgi:predicted transcriptional regulator
MTNEEKIFNYLLTKERVTCIKIQHDCQLSRITVLNALTKLKKQKRVVLTRIGRAIIYKGHEIEDQNQLKLF